MNCSGPSGPGYSRRCGRPAPRPCAGTSRSPTSTCAGSSMTWPAAAALPVPGVAAPPDSTASGLIPSCSDPLPSVSGAASARRSVPHRRADAAPLTETNQRDLVLARTADPLPDGNSGKTETQAAVPERRQFRREAVRRPAVGAALAPAAAPAHPARALEGVGPLPYVAVHVAQAQLVRGIGPHPCWPLEVRPLRCLGVRSVAVEVRLLGGQVVGRLIKVEVIRTLF